MADIGGGLLNAVAGFVGGGAETGKNIMAQDREQQMKQDLAQKQADITEQKQQALLEFQQKLSQASADQNAERSRSYNIKAGQDVDDAYQQLELKDPSRADMLRAKADIAERLGYSDHAKMIREQQKANTDEIRAIAEDKKADNERKFRTTSGGAHAPSEAQMTEFIATKVLGDTSRAGYKKAFAMVKQSKGKSADEQRANLAASLIKTQFMKPDEANSVASQLFPAEGDGDSQGGVDSTSGAVDYTKYIPKK